MLSRDGRGRLVSALEAVDTRTPHESDLGGASRTPVDAVAKEDWGLLVSIYSRRLLLAKAALAASRVPA
jgi:hypothetical protein